MVSGLNQFPAFLPLLTEKIPQPSNTSLKDIVDKTEPILIAFDGSGIFSDLTFWKLMDRNLIFPLDHRFHLLFYSSDIFMESITTSALNKPEILNPRLIAISNAKFRNFLPWGLRFWTFNIFTNFFFRIWNFSFVFKPRKSRPGSIRWWHQYCLWWSHR